MSKAADDMADSSRGLRPGHGFFISRHCGGEGAFQLPAGKGNVPAFPRGGAEEAYEPHEAHRVYLDLCLTMNLTEL